MKRLIPILISVFGLAILFGCSKSNSETTQQLVIPKYYHHVFNPPIELEKNDSFKLDLDLDKTYDIVFYVHGTKHVYPPSTDTIIKYNELVTALIDSLQFSLGSRIGSSNYNLLDSGKWVDSKLQWYHTMLFDGEGQSGHYFGQLEYVGIMKESGDSLLFGWTRNSSTDTTLTLYEYYFSNRSSHIVKAGIAD